MVGGPIVNLSVSLNVLEFDLAREVRGTKHGGRALRGVPLRTGKVVPEPKSGASRQRGARRRLRLLGEWVCWWVAHHLGLRLRRQRTDASLPMRDAWD